MSRSHPRRIAHLSTLVASLLLSGTGVVQAQAWKRSSDTAKAGWSASALEEARKFAADVGSAAIVIIDHGHVVAAWGHIDHPYKAASIRKSVYDATIGATHREKPFDVDASLQKLKINDLQPLTEREKSATFEQLMTARSGVYHPAAYESPSNAKRRPKRESAAPGKQWYYNNWDFNVVATAFEQTTGTKIETAFADRLARPLGMEDFHPRHIFAWLEPRASRHPAITMRLSARDLARIGLLYLRRGSWGEKQIVAPAWIERSTTPHTRFPEGHYRGPGNGYGRLWWIFPARPERNSAYQAHHRIAARGTGGQIMVLFPAIDVLIVHLADTDRGRGVSSRNGVALMDKIVAARRGKRTATTPLGPVQAQQLGRRTPGPVRTDFTAVPKALRAALVGRFMTTERIGVRIYEHADRLFVQPLGLPVASDTEVLQEPNGSLHSPLAALSISPIGKADEKVESIRVGFRGQVMTGKRVPTR